MDIRSSQPDTQHTRFEFAQWRMLLATMFCYLFFYTGRQTFGFAIPGIESELGISKVTLGWVSAAMLWSYAIGQSINGNLGDKFGGRAMMSLGAIVSCALNWIVSFGNSLLGIAVPWSMNGYAQSMAWAPGSRLLSNWWPHSRRGMVYGAYVFAAGMASVLAFATSTLILEFSLGWRWIFRLPVLLMAVGGTSYYLIARNKPEDLGFSTIEYGETPNEESSIQQEAELPGEETSAGRYRAVLSDRRFLIACIAIGFQSMARYGLLVWVPVHFLGEDWKNSDTKWVSIALPVGMALGALASGWISDRLFNANRSRVIWMFLLLAAGCSFGMYVVPRDSWLSIPLLMLTGFFAYGPQSAFWALCPDLLGHHRSGTGTGVMNSFAYLFAGLGEPAVGWLIDAYSDTSLVFAVVSIACCVGAFISLFIRR